MNIEYELGVTVECPVCHQVFELIHLDDEELNDSDLYFEHVTMCDGGEKHGKNKIF